MIKEENITVDASPKLFHLANKSGWYQQAGHEVKIGDYKFCVIGRDLAYMEISEVTTGMLIMKHYVEMEDIIKTAKKAETINYIKDTIGPKIKEKMEGIGDFANLIKKKKEIIESKFGKKPKNKIFRNLDDMSIYLDVMRGEQ